MNDLLTLLEVYTPHGVVEYGYEGDSSPSQMIYRMVQWGKSTPLTIKLIHPTRPLNNQLCEGVQYYGANLIEGSIYVTMCTYEIRQGIIHCFYYDCFRDFLSWGA